MPPPPEIPSPPPDHERQRALIDAALRQARAASTSHGPTLSPAAAEALTRWSAQAAPIPAEIPGYALLDEIYRGGQGVVYRAIQESTRRTVAIKIMREGPFSSAGERARFEREIRILAQLKHPNIVSIFHCDSAGGYSYYAMDYIDGLPLDEFIHESSLPLPARLNLFLRICEAVGEAHLRGIIHRDLKPGNIRVDRGGTPYVLDFGLSKITDDPEASATQTGVFVGSGPWASPEQASGRSNAVDIRTDVYSLGVLFFQMLTGEFPYDVSGPIPRVLQTVQTAPPRRPRSICTSIPFDVETIVLRCLQKEPQRRYTSAMELAADLRRFLAGEPVEARRDSGWYVVRKHLWRHRIALAVSTAFVTLVFASAIVAWWLYAEASRARKVADANSQEATRRLWQAQLAEARATRRSSRVGRRFDALAALRAAAAVRPDPALRDEALAAMTLSDLEILHRGPSGWLTSGDGLAHLDRLAHGDEDGTIRVVRLADQTELARLEGPPVPPWVLTFSTGGRYLAAKHHASSGDDYHFWVWDLTTQKTVIQLPVREGVHSGIVFGPAEDWVAITQRDKAIHAYNLPGGQPLWILPADPLPLHLALDSAGTRLAGASLYKPHLSVWDLTSLEPIAQLELPAPARTALWTPDGARLLVTCDDRRIYGYDSETWEVVATLEGHRGIPTGLFIDPSGRVLASNGWDNTSRLWSLSTGAEIFDGLEGWKFLGWSDRLVARTASQDFVVGTYGDAAEYRRLRIPGAGESGWPQVALAAEGKILVAAGDAGVSVLELDAPDEPFRLTPTSCYAVAATGDRVFALSRTGLHGWTRESGVWRGAGPDGLALALRDTRSVVASPATGMVLVGCVNEIHVLRLGTFERIATLEGYRGLSGMPSVSADRRWVFTGSWKGEAARVRALSNGAIVVSFEGPNTTGTFSPDGTRLVISDERTFTVLETGSWRVLRTVERAAGETIAGIVEFARDAPRACATYSRFEVRLLDIDVGAWLGTLPARGGEPVASLSLSPDGATLAIGYATDEVDVWRLDRAAETLRGLGLALTSTGAPE